QHYRHAEAVQVDVGQVKTEEGEAVRDVRGVERHVARPEEQVQRAFDDDRHRVTGQQRHRRAFAAVQRPDKGHLNDHADHEHGGDGDQQADEQVQVQVHGERVAEIGAEYHHHALGDVDDVQHAEDQREADGHQCIDAAAQNAVDHGT